MNAPRRFGRGREPVDQRADINRLWLKKRKFPQGQCIPREKRGITRPLAASSTSSAWPGTLTFGQIRAMRPSASIRKVLRMTPMNLRPYIDFSPQAP